MVELKKETVENLKFLCSYGGKILPRSTDGKLRYVGGLTRVFSVERSISFAELMVKLGEFCGNSVTLRCQLPNGDLETLISIKSDEDLANLIEEYDRAASNAKIRAILCPPASLKQVSPPTSVDSSSSVSSPSFRGSDRRSGSRPSSPSTPPYCEYPVRGSRHFSPPPRYPVSGKVCRYPCYVQGNPRSLYCGPHTHMMNHWH